MDSIKFPMDQEEDNGHGVNGVDPGSPRSQAKNKELDRFYYNHWKVEWQSELLYLPFQPKNPLASFADKEGAIFMSAKKPLLIAYNLADEDETEAALSA